MSSKTKKVIKVSPVSSSTDTAKKPKDSSFEEGYKLIEFRGKKYKAKYIKGVDKKDRVGKTGEDENDEVKKIKVSIGNDDHMVLEEIFPDGSSSKHVIYLIVETLELGNFALSKLKN